MHMYVSLKKKKSNFFTTVMCAGYRNDVGIHYLGNEDTIVDIKT